MDIIKGVVSCVAIVLLFITAVYFLNDIRQGRKIRLWKSKENSTELYTTSEIPPYNTANILHYRLRNSSERWSINSAHMRYSFCSMPKNGYRTTTTIFMLTEHAKLCENLPESVNSSLVDWRQACMAEYRKVYRKPFHLTHYRHKIKVEAQKTFVIVRDPIDRFISAYLDKCVNDGKCLTNEAVDFPAFVARFIKYERQKHGDYRVRTKRRRLSPNPTILPVSIITGKTISIFSGKTPQINTEKSESVSSYENSSVSSEPSQKYGRVPRIILANHYEPQTTVCPIRELMERDHVIRFCHGIPFAESLGDWLKQENISNKFRKKIVSAVGDQSHSNFFTFHSPHRKKVENFLKQDPQLFRSLLDIFYEDYQVIGKLFPMYQTFEYWKTNCCHC